MESTVLNPGTDAARRALTASLVAGIAHDLNGRLGALLGVSHLARASAALDDDLVEVLDEQIGRLREAVGLLRSVPLSDGSGEAKALSLADIVNSTVRLYRCRGGPDLASIQVIAEGDPPIVTAVPPALIEALLLGLAATERGRAGRSCAVRITYGAVDGGSRVRLERDGPEPADEEAILGEADEAAVLAAAATRAEVAGARLFRADAGVVEVTLP